jgi:hypothetical protein
MRVSATMGILALTALISTEPAMAQRPANGIEIVELRPQSPAVMVRWVADGDESWRTGEPTFAMAEEAGGALTAKGWLAISGEHLLVRLDVTDPVHLNDKTGDRIWDGDFVRIGLDGRGDGAGGGRADAAGLFGPDDVSIGLALTTSGAASWTYASDPPPSSIPLPPELLSFSRDEELKLTRYDVRIPWDRLRVTAGAFPTFGIVVQVRSVDSADQREPVHIRWGDGANAPQPGLFKTVAIAGRPAGELATASVVRDTIWDSGDSADVVVAVASDPPRSIAARAGEQTASRQVTAGELQHFAIRYRPAASGDAASLTVRIDGTDASATVVPVIPDRAVEKLCSRIDSLIPQSPHPLYTRHLRSLKAMALTEWGRAALYKRDNIALARETLTCINDMARGLEGEAGDWATYRDGRLPLYMSYISPRDGTLQWYELTLPQGWDAAKSRDEQEAYPLFVELHGAGNPHYLASAAARLSLKVRSAPKIGYHIAPFGRGNSGYRDIGETDVWEAYSDVHEAVRIDEDRQYLYGFSMGGGGTWNLGSRTPDRWAAIGILGMAPNPGTSVGLARNVAGLPIWVWAGEQDQFASKARLEAFGEELRKQGADPQIQTSPNVGHNYLGEKQVEVYEFLIRHTRRRPEQFAFVADTPEHRGVWGIQMARDLSVSGAPSFTCRIDGQSVRIDSQGAPGLTVDLGSDGLRMAGEVTVMWNKAQAYQGPVNATGRPIRLGEVDAGGPRR